MSKKLDIQPGMVFDNWTVVRSAADRKSGCWYECKCVCGRIREISAHGLMYEFRRCDECSGFNSLNRKDLLGMRFTNWIVLERKPSVDGRRRYLCKCDCGRIKEINASSLVSGKSTSCGCMRSMNTALSFRNEDASYSTITQIWCSYVKEARERKLTFELTRPQFEVIIRKNCYYCDRPPFAETNKWINTETGEWNNVKRGQYAFRDRGWAEGATVTWTGIDRVDNNIGYTVDNSVPCCRDRNRAKRTLSLDEFISLCHMVSINHPQKIEAVA